MNPASQNRLADFLAKGKPPVVFTLGSAAVQSAGSFYQLARQAVQTLGVRAIFLNGSHPSNQLTDLPDTLLALPYAPHSAVFPHGSVIVHQGGVGTTAQALRAGRPMLVVPFSHDQPDNAARITRLGVGRTLPRNQLTTESLCRQLRPLLDQLTFTHQAQAIAEQLHTENGSTQAALTLETLLNG